MKLQIVIGLVIMLCAFAKSDPTCTFSFINEIYTCTMTNSQAGTSTIIVAQHPNASYVDTKVLSVITADKADTKVIKLILAKFTNLQTLQIANGEITTLVETDFVTCSALKNLQISKGTLPTIGMDTFLLCYPEEIDLSTNGIAKIERNAFRSSIKKLILANNTIDVTPVTSPATTIFDTSNVHTNLVHLDLSGNSFASFPDTFMFSSAAITYLDLSRNTLTAFPEKQFINSNKIQNLHMNGNQITEIKTTSLEKLVDLKELRLASNKITGDKINVKAFEKNINLEILDISGNELASLDAAIFNGLTKLKTLDLHNNKLANTSLAAIKTAFESLTTLEYIDISTNVIGSLGDPFSKNVNLKHLNVSSISLERFTDTTLSTLAKLETFRFSSNKITEIPEKLFEKTTVMKEIHGVSNKIVKLKASTFEKMTNLEVLDLSSNEINEIERTFFDKLSKLKVVKFSGGNKCINKDFTEFTLNDATKSDLEPCFKNYNGAGAIIISNLLLAFVVALKFI